MGERDSESIDIKDRKILYLLDLNARQSFTQIARSSGLGKHAVAERVENLLTRGIIRNFYTVIDVYKLGCIMMRFHYKFQYTRPEIERDIINFFINRTCASMVASALGHYNLKVVEVIQDIDEFYKNWQEAQRKFGPYFQERSSALFINEIYYEPSYLLDESTKRGERKKWLLVGGGKKIDLDETDMELLHRLSASARMPIIELSDHLGCSISVTKKRLKKLIDKGVIQGFRVDMNTNELGFQIFRANMFLSSYNLRSDIINYVKSNPNLAFIDTYTGEADLEMEFHLKQLSQFSNIIDNVVTQFPGAIRQHNYLNIVKYHKFQYMP